MTNGPSSTVIKNPTWWRRRTYLERVLLFIVFITTGLSVLLVVLLSVANYQTAMSEALPTMAALETQETKGMTPTTMNTSNVENLCLSSGCIHEASSLLDKMDLTADPCKDFYQFTCGKFRKRRIPFDKSSISTFSVISDNLQEQLLTVVSAPVEKNELRPFLFAKNLYSMCMNKKQIEAEGADKVKHLLHELGGWPVLEGDLWDVGSFNWKKTIYAFRKYGFSVDFFIDFSVGTDLKNSTARIIDLDQGALGLSREYLIKGMDNKLVKAYYSYMVDIATLFGADHARAEKELMESLQFEMSLANISLPLEQRRNATKLYNKMTIADLQTKYPSIPWKEYISTIMPKRISITENEPVILNVPKYVSDLEGILMHTPKRIQANYLLWRAAASTVSYLPEIFRNRQLAYATAISGKTERESRWKECVDVTAGSMSLAVGSQYIRKFFDEASKKSALELVQRIRKEMYKILNTVDWMDDATRMSALDKAKSMTAHIAYPDELLDNNKLVEFYTGFEVNNGSYLEAIMNITKFATDYSFGRLRDPVNKTEWISHGRPAVVNAFYSSIENSIQFPAGILQGSFFSNARPKYMNYGAIGYVIGHEITHGFDDQGRQFDKEGNLVDWWAPKTMENYLERARCIIYQYGNFTDSQVNMSLNGINTQGENIADNGGIKQAYRAYVEWAKENGNEPRLPGLQQFSERQMFWISAASTWCTVYRDEALQNRITTAFHSPGEFRVKGPMSNMEEFASDFQCPRGTPMNPVKKCTVW